jgi:hypothetical protein
MQKMRKLGGAVVMGAAMLGACTEAVPATGPHPPTDAWIVKIFQTPPSRYEKLGTVTLELTPQYHWDDRADAKPAFDALKTKAAALGATGILLTDEEGKAVVSVGAGYEGKYYTVPLRRNPNTAVAQAIYVVKQ